MSLEFLERLCPACGETVRIRPEDVGTGLLACPHCSAQFDLPAGLARIADARANLHRNLVQNRARVVRSGPEPPFARKVTDADNPRGSSK